MNYVTMYPDGDEKEHKMVRSQDLDKSKIECIVDTLGNVLSSEGGKLKSLIYEDFNAKKGESRFMVELAPISHRCEECKDKLCFTCIEKRAFEHRANIYFSIIAKDIKKQR